MSKGFQISPTGLTETMYLFRGTNCTYFTRICFSKALKNRGFPFDIKISLLTKVRSVATKRHLDISLAVINHIERINETISPVEFKSSLNERINKLRTDFECEYPVTLIRPFCVPEVVQSLPLQLNVAQITLTVALDSFVESKYKESILESTVRQLAQRIKHFIKSTQHPNVNQTTTSSALLYRDLLLSQGRTYKTNKEYLAAISQFFKWCCLMNYIDKNPFIDIPNRNNDGTGAYSARRRWQPNELNLLIQSDEFKAKDKNFQWITLVLLYQGLRPGEACQLYTDDIVEQDDLLCIHVNDSEPLQRLKNVVSNRVIPIHPALLKLGFADFVNDVKTKKSKPLFNCEPGGQDDDWSKNYCQRLGRLSTKLNLLPNDRPSAYGFRHTFIDALKQQEVDESLVSQLVGHTHKNLTFGKYGKKFPVGLLLTKLENLNFSIAPFLTTIFLSK
jgi:integrase